MVLTSYVFCQLIVLGKADVPCGLSKRMAEKIIC